MLRLRIAKHRKRSGRILIDGDTEIRRALDSGIEIEAIVGSAASVEECELASGVDRIALSDSLMAKLAYGDRVEQLMGIALEPARSLDLLEAESSSLVLVIDRIEKPGNVGACLRTAAAVGADATIVSDPQCDLWNANVIRASRGAVFGKNIAVAGGVEVRAWLQSQGLPIFLALTNGEQGLWDCDFRRGGAIVLGNEARGLGAEWTGIVESSGATGYKVPMADEAAADSLNVSICAAVSLYEAARQRR